jgi:hypothetical protein
LLLSCHVLLGLCRSPPLFRSPNAPQ